MGETFSIWLIKYFEELTKLLQLNEKLNALELERVLTYVYIFLTVELLVFAFLSYSENLDQNSTM